MDLKKLLIKEATRKILPMEDDKPKLGGKAKAAALLGTVAAVATAASHFLGG
jgi:hypothetical protein